MRGSDLCGAGYSKWNRARANDGAAHHNYAGLPNRIIRNADTVKMTAIRKHHIVDPSGVQQSQSYVTALRPPACVVEDKEDANAVEAQRGASKAALATNDGDEAASEASAVD